MKKILLTLIALTTAVGLHAQGRVAFANNPTSLLTFGPAGGPFANIAPATAFRIGLYVGPAGTAVGNLELVSSGLNGAVAGLFAVANPLVLPAATALAPGGYPAGVSIAFQVRAWSAAAGATYEQAIANGNTTQFAGTSTLGFVTPTAAPAAAGALFGTSPGQIGGFRLTPIPEPSTIALALLGGVLLLFRRRK